MSRQTYIYDPDLDCVRPKYGHNQFEERSGPNLIRDDLPGGINGMLSHADARIYTSKSRYLREVRARGYEVVGNDTGGPKKPVTPRSEYEREAVVAREQIAGNWNDTRGWLRQHNERTEWKRRNG